MLQPIPTFITALYFGFNKTNEADEFMQDFMEEYKKLNSVSFEQGNQTFNVVICDAPACHLPAFRGMLMNVVL